MDQPVIFDKADSSRDLSGPAHLPRQGTTLKMSPQGQRKTFILLTEDQSPTGRKLFSSLVHLGAAGGGLASFLLRGLSSRLLIWPGFFVANQLAIKWGDGIISLARRLREERTAALKVPAEVHQSLSARSQIKEVDPYLSASVGVLGVLGYSYLNLSKEVPGWRSTPGQISAVPRRLNSLERTFAGLGQSKGLRIVFLGSALVGVYGAVQIHRATMARSKSSI